MSIKVVQNDFTRKMIDFDTFYKNCLRMWEIWANSLLPKASKKLPKVKLIAQSGHTGCNPPYCHKKMVVYLIFCLEAIYQFLRSEFKLFPCQPFLSVQLIEMGEKQSPGLSNLFLQVLLLLLLEKLKGCQMQILCKSFSAVACFDEFQSIVNLWSIL